VAEVWFATDGARSVAADISCDRVQLPTTAPLIAGDALMQTTTIHSVLSVNNPGSESAALTITPAAGGPAPAAASLVIERLP